MHRPNWYIFADARQKSAQSGLAETTKLWHRGMLKLMESAGEISVVHELGTENVMSVAELGV